MVLESSGNQNGGCRTSRRSRAVASNHLCPELRELLLAGMQLPLHALTGLLLMGTSKRCFT